MLLSLAAASPAWATNGMRMIGFGPVQNSMGGVGVGATLDAASTVSNPAGLTELGPRLDVGIGWFKPIVDYSATAVPGAPPIVVEQPGVKLDSNRGGSPIPVVATAIPLGSGFTFGAGAFAVAGMGVDYPSNLYGGRTYTSYLQGRLTPAIAYKVSDLLSIGVGVNGMLAQMSYDVAAGFGQVPHDTATALGIGAVVGVKVTPMPELSIGAAWESKSFFQEFSFDIPAHTGLVPGVGPVPFPGGTDKLSFNQPQVATVGASVKPMGEVLVIAGDVEFINWAQTNGQGMPKFTSDTTQTGSLPFNLSWQNQWVFKLGVQVAPMEPLKIRAGWNYGKLPLDPGRAFENIAFPAIAEHHFTLGGSFDFSKEFGVTLAGMYAPRATLSGSNPQEQFIASYDTGMSQWQVDAGFAYRF